ncbi:tRNA 2-selenouridine(34) synthase MnmH [Oceanimonas sp. CAM02]|uniref:tRNA 2-selenouridine(34) synthase MnmH n=1 Tax=Oceanimonas sp. CAM02 TaxID=3080336 RepID=UPI002935A6B0|nr:tRNA 2-selenouridine(34) synthase MnmH [Oceanimonas sp. CAM02]MDV2858642.1 tRNA 2-selenouridine(34) synthase MnmH [Oceanimonas sp. CAM02]
MPDLHTDLDALFINNTPLLDLRAPVEFLQGAFPASRNQPLMTDDERAQVGTCYKHEGQQAAIELGHQLVCGEIRQARLQGWLNWLEQNPDGVLYCFRGGLRSQTVQQWLNDAGRPVSRVKGGYKALRRRLLTEIEQGFAGPGFVLTGLTGSGKTDWLARSPLSLDLEGYAHHRGSSFGNWGEPQPTPINFENRLAIARLKQRHSGIKGWLVEDESAMIGRCPVPLPLYERMQQAPLLLLEVPFEQRVQQIRHDYVDTMQRHFNQDFARLESYLQDSLKRLYKRLGDREWRRLSEIMSEAVRQQQLGYGSAAHEEWIATLLGVYYDPIYARHQAAKADRIVKRGDADELAEWLAQQPEAQPEETQC